MLRRPKILLVALLLICGVGAGVWFGRTSVLSWYYVNGLASATNADREVWVERVVSLDEDALPGLLELLRRGQPTITVNALSGISSLVERWGVGHARTPAILEELVQRFSQFDESSKVRVLDLHITLLRGKQHLPMEHATQLLTTASDYTENGVRLRTLILADQIANWVGSEVHPLLARLAFAGLNSTEADQRARAVYLVMHHPLREQQPLLQSMLADRSAEVRRAVLIVAGKARDLIHDEDLLPLLHDMDTQVRQLCESALRVRDFDDQRLLLARLISDARPTERMQVVLHLADAESVDAGLWLRLLSQDPSPAVRAAAVRAAPQFPDYNPREFLQRVAQSDPEETVCQLASHYLAKLPTR